MNIRLFFIISSLITMVAIYYLFVYEDVEAKQNLEIIKQEFFKNPPPPKTQINKKNESYDLNKAQYVEYYKTDLPIDEVITYYNNILMKNGWIYSYEKAYTEDFGKTKTAGKVIYYKKGKFCAVLSYPLKKDTWTYYFLIKWSVYSPCK